MAQDENPLELRIDEALAEYMHQCDSGSMPDRESFLNSYPELREQLLELLSAADWIENLAGPTMMEVAAGSSVSNPNSDDLSDATLEIGDTLPHFDPRHQEPLADTLDGQPIKVQLLKAAQPKLPCLFGDYVLERVLGRGGMGVVYYAHQSQLDRPVAVKMIRSGALASDEEVERFFAEARNAAALQHPNIVTVYQCGEEDGHRYFSMDYVEGTDLAQLTKDSPIDGRVAARYVRDVARAIQYAHDRGILHRDLKPANILVDRDDNVRITDFGLAKSVGTESGLTATGAAVGTPSYMSPEQASGNVQEQYHATDIYSLGAILFTLVTGKPPFKAPTVVQTIMHVIHRPAPMARSLNIKVEQDLETIIDKCLQKSPDRRYESASALADDLDRYLNRTPIHARPMSHARRVWYWFLGVPIIGAVLDHRVLEPTDAHRWFQRGIISIAMLMLLAWLAFMVPGQFFSNRMPKTVRFASGMTGGSYDSLARAVCESLGARTQCEAIPITTDGSTDNIDRLINGEVDLALLQGDALGRANVALVAPLYYEAVHIVVRKGYGIRKLEDLRGRRVNVGMEKAGSRGVAQLVLGSVGIDLSDIQIDTSDWHRWITAPVAEAAASSGDESNSVATVQESSSINPPTTSGSEKPETEAAIIVSRLGSQDMVDLLATNRFSLLSLPAALELSLNEPSFHALPLKPASYPGVQLPESGVLTIATAAFLAATHETPSILVETVLQNLFSPNMVQSTGIFTPEQATHWQSMGSWHPAAQKFFAHYRSIEPNQ